VHAAGEVNACAGSGSVAYLSWVNHPPIGSTEWGCATNTSCKHIVLNLNVGGMTGLPSTHADEVNSGPITFNSGVGTGWGTETCAYVPGGGTCTADAVISWAAAQFNP